VTNPASRACPVKVPDLIKSPTHTTLVRAKSQQLAFGPDQTLLVRVAACVKPWVPGMSLPLALTRHLTDVFVEQEATRLLNTSVITSLYE